MIKRVAYPTAAMPMRLGASWTPTFHPSAGKSPTRRSRGFFIRKFCRKSAIIALIYLLDRFHRRGSSRGYEFCNHENAEGLRPYPIF
jgi:hypothetical protein